MKSIEIKQFAPVIIPTLCRFNHFRACLESLMKCTYSDKTDVYIGLDFPAKKEHWEGYRKISEYLDKIKDKNSFKNLYIVKREKNYGLGASGNYYSLRKQVFEKYDTCIVSEDDNIFSPSFLDYCNKGLNKFRENKSVIGICGYRNYYDFKFDNNTFSKQSVDFVAWGYATWKDRVEELEKVTPHWFRNQFNLYRFIKFCRTNGNYRGLCWLQFCLRPKKNFTMPDDGISVYMGLQNKYTIMPYVSLVRNLGVDGSGAHFKNIWKKLKKNFDNQEIYEASEFEFIGTGDEFYKENMKINVKNAYNRIRTYRFPLEIMKMFFSKSKTYYNRLRSR